VEKSGLSSKCRDKDHTRSYGGIIATLNDKPSWTRRKKRDVLVLALKKKISLGEIRKSRESSSKHWGANSPNRKWTGKSTTFYCRREGGGTGIF